MAEKKVTFTFKADPTLKKRAEAVLGDRKFSAWIARLAENDLKRLSRSLK